MPPANPPRIAASFSPVDLPEFNRILRAMLLLPVLLLAVLAGLLVWLVQNTLDVQNQVDRSDSITRHLQSLEQYALGQETAMGAFQLTGLPSTLQPYQTGTATIERTLATLRDLYGAQHPGQSGSTRGFTATGSAKAHDVDELVAFREMVASLRQWQDFADKTIAGKQQALPQSDAVTLQDKALMDSLRRRIAALVGSEIAERDALSLDVHHRIDSFLVVVLGTALAAGILIGLVTSNRLRLVSSVYNSALLQLQGRNDALAESQHLLLTTLESIGDAVISCDTAGHVRFMNAIAQKLTQWTSAEAEGRPLREVLQLMHEHTRQPAEDLLEEVRSSGSAQLTTGSLLLARDGAEYSVDHTTSPVRGDHGRVEGMVVVLRDVTELRHAEATLIANEKLAVTGRLAASIAHEIHNPLDSVSNLHFLLGHETDPGKRSDYLALAQQELSRTLQISRAMLSLYRESQVPVQVNLEELISSVLLLLDRKMKDGGIVVEQCFTHPVEVQGFPGELRQVFTNLIANAAEAAGAKGRVRIHVRPASPQDGRAGTLVEITDSGPGIAPHVEKKLFQPFITTKGERGTGLGLWVSLGIVQKHGGTVRITNNQQGELRGAVVRVYLPEKTAIGFAAAPLAN